MPSKKRPPVHQTATGDGNVQIAGDNNTVNQTIIQKFFNIFRSDAETVDQRNRRIMLGHVENFWVKGILEKSLHGAALLDLGVKEDPDALTYPWAIKREVNKEILPAGISMLEIFQEIGMGRSLLILGAPGSGKTTMLLELTRQLIERAREDVTEPIPVVFNLSSWTGDLTLADWLARELNVIYTIPKKIAPTWVKENKMLLLLDGLDEVKQESHDKCVDAINQFRKENGLTSMAVCSRIQDYAELKTRLSFEGAIEIQLLTSNQVNEYFKRFGKGLAGIRQVLEKDTVLREMAETPLFLSIMTLAYRNTQSKDILVLNDLDTQRKQLFDTYIECMFGRPERSKNEKFIKQDILHWLAWLAKIMAKYNQVPYLLENMQPNWLNQNTQSRYILVTRLMVGLMMGLVVGTSSALMFGQDFDLDGKLYLGLFIGLTFALIGGQFNEIGGHSNIEMVDILTWDWKRIGIGLVLGPFIGLIIGSFSGLVSGIDFKLVLIFSIWVLGLPSGLLIGLITGLHIKSISQTTYPGQRLFLSVRNFCFVFLFILLFIVVSILPIGRLSFDFTFELTIIVWVGIIIGLWAGFMFGGLAIFRHYAFRLIVTYNNLLPWKLIPFLDQCVDLIFLRKVGGGYIFVHRLLMEYFATMYQENN